MADFLLLKEKILEVKETLESLGTQDEGLISSIASAIQSLNEIKLEDGIIGQFTQLKEAVDAVSSAISGGGESSGSEGKGGNSGSGNGGKSGGSKYGQTEITVLPNGDTIITDEPAMMDLPKDTVIYNEEQTKKIMDNKVDVSGTAHNPTPEKAVVNSDGTIVRPDGRVMSPISLEEYMRELREKYPAPGRTMPQADDEAPLYPSQETLDFMKRSKQWEMKMDLIANNTYGILSPLHIIKQNMENMMSNTNNINNVTNKNVQQPVTVHQNVTVNCPNVTNNSGVENVIVPDNCKWILNKIRRLCPFGQYVFMQNNERVRSYVFRTRLYSNCKKLDIVVKSPHKVRKTYGSKLYDSGEIPESFMLEQMGHTDISCLKKHYYYNRMNNEEKREILNQVNAL